MSKPVSVVATMFIRDVEILFDPCRFKESCKSRLEDSTLDEVVRADYVPLWVLSQNDLFSLGLFLVYLIILYLRPFILNSYSNHL